MINPRFSIITITKNNLKGLQSTAKSVMEQASQNYEWIIIDGTSIDGTIDYLKTLNKPFISEPDSGIYDAMNKGIERANGQYLIFLNAGDCLESPTTLQEIKNRLEHQNYDFIYGDSAEMNNDEIHFKRARPHNKITHGMFTHHQAMIYNTKALKALRYNTIYKISADYDLTWQVIENSNDFLYLPFPICIFQAGGISQQKILLGRIEQFKIRRNHGISLFKNVFIFASQTMVYYLRKFFPAIYWRLKRG